MRDMQFAQQAFQALVDFRFGQVLQFEHRLHILLYRQLPEDGRFLGQIGQAQSRAAVDRKPADFLAVQADAPAVEPHQADHHIKAGGLAGAVRPEQADHLAALHFQRHVITLANWSRIAKCLVNQRELGSDAQSFSEALKAALRQDPDVILVGEMRDLDTISTALTAAETGHLVFTTLHTHDASQTIDRVIDVFPAHQQGQIRVQLAICLQGIFSQPLCPRGRLRPCVGHGASRAQPAMRNLIREGKTHQIYSVLQTGSAQGMQRSRWTPRWPRFVRQGKINQKFAESRSSTPEELRRLLGFQPSLAAA